MTDIAATVERASAGSEAARQLALMILATPHRYSDAAVIWAEVERDRRALDSGTGSSREVADR
ncbi:MAG: hypothetical protein NVS3B12_07090 [Acidimicrobiales bacterium]